MTSTRRYVSIGIAGFCLSAFLSGCGLVEIFGRGLGALCDTEIFLVTKSEDTNDGVCTAADCSLREAVITANECPGENVIQLASGTYSLSLSGSGSPSYPSEFGTLSITDSLVLHGRSATIGGSGIDISGVATRVEMSELTLQGRVSNTAELAFNNVTIQDSRSGAVFNAGTFSMSGGAILRNTRPARITSSSAAFGVSVIINDGGLMELRDLEIANNSLEAEFEDEYPPLNAIENLNGDLRLTRVAIHDNNVPGNRGAALVNRGESAVASLDQVTIYGQNEYAIYDGSMTRGLTIVDSTIRDNPGGAILTDGGNVTIQRTTISGNGDGGNNRFRTPPCGTMINASDMRIENSTLSGNHRDAGCPLIENQGELEITSSTLFGNENDGGAIHGSGGLSTTRLQGSILAGNASDNCIAAGLTSLGGNLFDDGTCAGTPGPGDMTSLGSDLGILPLAENGGPTLTHALQPGSPAVDLAGTDCPLTDQRGSSRPGGSACDAGAFELEMDPSGTPLSASGEGPRVSPFGPVTCRTGPSVVYPPLAYFDIGQDLALLNRNGDASWVEVQGEFEPPCWIRRDLLDIPPEFNILDLTPGIIPPTPTWTPPPPTHTPESGPVGCWHQGPNDNQPLCYVPCPPNPNPGGACTP